MSQALHTSSVETGNEEQLALIERRWKVDNWIKGILLIAIFLLMIVGSIVLLL